MRPQAPRRKRQAPRRQLIASEGSAIAQVSRDGFAFLDSDAERASRFRAPLSQARRDRICGEARAANSAHSADQRRCSVSAIDDKRRETPAPLVASTPPDDLTGLAGNGQGNAIVNFGSDQEVTPPNEDVAAGPTDLVEVVNSTVYVYARNGGVLAASDLNTFMSVTSGYHSSDPRVIYDASAGRFWITITEVPDDYSSPGNCPAAQPVLIAVSGSSNPLPLSSWTVYALPMETFGGSSGQPLTEFGDQPGLGIATNTVTVTFDDFDCANDFNGSEIDILQKTDFETDSGTHSDDFFFDGPFAPQPVQAIGVMGTSYVVSNQSDCAGNGCDNSTPAVEVHPFIGTPEAGTIPVPIRKWLTITPTAVNDTTFFLPPADQPSPGRNCRPTTIDFSTLCMRTATSGRRMGQVASPRAIRSSEIA